mmetsp:Transcript_119/g.317  ORF Transcript_119/g.317 Transcript_119/m.317 type:complete len:201 (-) Transcript_119:160-762(-)
MLLVAPVIGNIVNIVNFVPFVVGATIKAVPTEVLDLKLPHTRLSVVRDELGTVSCTDALQLSRVLLDKFGILCWLSCRLIHLIHAVQCDDRRTVEAAAHRRLLRVVWVDVDGSLGEDHDGVYVQVSEVHGIEPAHRTNPFLAYRDVCHVGQRIGIVHCHGTQLFHRGLQSIALPFQSGKDSQVVLFRVGRRQRLERERGG